MSLKIKIYRNNFSFVHLEIQVLLFNSTVKFKGLRWRMEKNCSPKRIKAMKSSLCNWVVFFYYLEGFLVSNSSQLCVPYTYFIHVLKNTQINEKFLPSLKDRPFQFVILRNENVCFRFSKNKNVLMRTKKL